MYLLYTKFGEYRKKGEEKLLIMLLPNIIKVNILVHYLLILFIFLLHSCDHIAYVTLYPTLFLP